MKGLTLALILTAAATAAFAQATAAVDPNGWVKEVATANKLLAAGYVDAAQKDFEGIIQRYPSTVAGIDQAWLGLSKIHMSRYEYDQAKVSLESILQRNSDPISVAGARATYLQLKQEADGQAQQAQKALQYEQMLYDQTSWLNPFAKLFTYLDLRKARQASDTATAAANGYDPHYFIDALPAASSINTNFTLSSTDFQPAANGTTVAAGVSVHSPAPGESPSPTSSPAAKNIAAASPAPAASPAASAVLQVGALPSSPAPAASPAMASLVVSPSPAAGSPSPTPQPSPIVISGSPAPAASPAAATAASSTATPSAAATPDLLSLQHTYQDAYRKLQAAIAMGNQSEIVKLSNDYQAALNAYRKAADSGRR